MAWGAVAGAAIGVVGGALASDAQSSAATSAANTSAGATKYATDVQKQMFEQQRADQEPWRQAGTNALGALLYGTGLPQYAPTSGGQTYAQLRAELLPQYTTQTQASNINQPALTGGTITPMGQNDPLSAAYQGNQTTINEDALNVEINRRLALQAGQSAPADYSATGINQGGLLRPFAMSDYQADPGYQFRLDEGMKALERSAAARGGLLSGASMKGIERFGQQTASDEYQNAYNRYQTNQGNQFNRLASLAGVGQTATNALGQAGQAYAGSVGNLAMTNASNVGNAQLSAGQSRASAYQGIGGALGNMFSNTGSSGYNPYAYSTQYGTSPGSDQTNMLNAQWG